MARVRFPPPPQDHFDGGVPHQLLNDLEGHAPPRKVAAVGVADSGTLAHATTSLKPGTWNTVTLPIPLGAVSPFHELGLETFTDAPWGGVPSQLAMNHTGPFTSVPG